MGGVRVRNEGGVGGMKVLDFAHIASCHMLFLPSLLAFSSNSSKLLHFAAFIAAPLALLVALYSSSAQWDLFHLLLLNALISFSLSQFNVSDHIKTWNRASLDMGTCCLMTSSIPETKS